MKTDTHPNCEIKAGGDAQKSITKIQDEFIQHWGEMGTLWGINRAMGQLHALLLTAKEPLSVDNMMSRLNMSRGNVSMNIRELKHWGVVHVVYLKGDRKTYYRAEDDIWIILERILKERKKRELEPTERRIDSCLIDLTSFQTEEADVFRERLERMQTLIKILNSTADYFLTTKKTDPITLLKMVQAILNLKSR